MAICLPLLAAAACSVSLGDLGALRPDRTAVTHSVPVAGGGSANDEGALRNSLLDALAELVSDPQAGVPLAWTGPNAEARGVVTWIGAEEDACRRFLSTRESFDGVALYKGMLCRAPAAGWQLRSFEPVEPAPAGTGISS